VRLLADESCDYGVVMALRLQATTWLRSSRIVAVRKTGKSSLAPAASAESLSLRIRILDSWSWPPTWAGRKVFSSSAARSSLVANFRRRLSLSLKPQVNVYLEQS
jgi:hypothetical protein